MTDLKSEELRYANELIREGKLQEALKIINSIEKKGTLTPLD